MNSEVEALRGYNLILSYRFVRINALLVRLSRIVVTLAGRGMTCRRVRVGRGFPRPLTSRMMDVDSRTGRNGYAGFGLPSTSETLFVQSPLVMTDQDSEKSQGKGSDRLARTAIAPARQRLFRAIAVAVPVAAGLVAVVLVLFHQERLVLDPETGYPRLQAPPLYLEEPGHERTGHRYLFDARLGWRNIPNWKSKTNGQTISINSLGLRDREYSHAKPEGVRRILVLGDSYVWGYGVSNDEIFTELLEEQLADLNKNWEVLNSGVSGWGTDQEFLFLTDEGFKYDPDIVVLFFFLGNDATNNTNSKQYTMYKPVFQGADLKLSNVPVPRPDDQKSRPTGDDPMQHSVSLIAKISAACQAHGSKLVIVKFGTFLNPRRPDLAKWDQEFSVEYERRIEDPLLDLDQAFADNGISAPLLLIGNDDGHWNAYGHKQVARIMYKYLNETNLLKARQP